MAAGYDTFLPTQRDSQVAPRRQRVLLASVALALVAGVVLVGAFVQSPTRIVLVDPEESVDTYGKWLGTLNGDTEYDKDWESENMPHRDLTDLTPGALPHMKHIGALQGEDFRKDVVSS